MRKLPAKELDPLLALVETYAKGETSLGSLVMDVQELRNKRHESYGDCGKFEIDRAVDTAVAGLEEMRLAERKRRR